MKKDYSSDLVAGTFVKKASISKSKVEILMSQAAFEISGKSAGFYCPKLLSVDEEKGQMTFELLKNCKNLRKVFIEKAGLFSSQKDRLELEEIFNRVGAALYQAHSILSKNNYLEKYSISTQYTDNQLDKDLVFIHGDFTLNNVMYEETSDKIYFIDWSSSPVFEQPANFGPRFWDLSFFISSTYYFSFSTFSKVAFREKLINRFLDGYLEKFENSDSNFRKNMFLFLSKNNYYNLYRSYWENQNLSLRDKFFQSISANFLNRFTNKNL